MRHTEVARGIFTIEQLLEATECEALVRRAEVQGFESAPIITASGARVEVDTRNNDRCVFDDAVLAENLWQRARTGNAFDCIAMLPANALLGTLMRRFAGRTAK